MEKKLKQFYQEIKASEHLIAEDRKKELSKLASHILDAINSFGIAKVICVCTHNSRRSQLMEILLRFVAECEGIQNIQTYSGGTEATAFNHRSVAALRHHGFQLAEKEPGKNPKYVLAFADNNFFDQLFFSKKYDDSYNPQEGFIAVMVCAEADADCPFVPGAFHRFSLPYIDPKVADDTPEENNSYRDKALEIGREMFYVVDQLK